MIYECFSTTLYFGEIFYLCAKSLELFSRVHATLWPTLSVGLSVRPSVTLNFFAAPAHPHATSARVYGFVYTFVYVNKAEITKSEWKTFLNKNKS